MPSCDAMATLCLSRNGLGACVQGHVMWLNLFCRVSIFHPGFVHQWEYIISVERAVDSAGKHGELVPMVYEQNSTLSRLLDIVWQWASQLQCRRLVSRRIRVSLPTSNSIQYVSFVCICSYGPGEDDVASGGISSDNKPRIVLMGLRR